MSKQEKSRSITRLGSVRREGFTISVETKQVSLADGTSGTTFGFNLAEAEIPEKHYHARACGAEFSHQEVNLLFAQPQRGRTSGQKIRTLLVVSMPAMAITTMLNSLSRLQPSLDDIVIRANIQPESTIALEEEANQTIELDANIAAMAFSGNEACLDFYESSPFSFAQVKTTGTLGLIPVVRINTRTSLVVGLLDRLRELQSSNPSAFRIAAGEHI